MAHYMSIAAKDVNLEELNQVSDAVSELPQDSELRKFIDVLISGLDLGFDMTLIFDRPIKISK